MCSLLVLWFLRVCRMRLPDQRRIVVQYEITPMLPPFFLCVALVGHFCGVSRDVEHAGCRDALLAVLVVLQSGHCAAFDFCLGNSPRLEKVFLGKFS